MKDSIDFEIFDIAERKSDIDVNAEVEKIRNELIEYYSKVKLDYPATQIRIETIKNASALGVMEMRLLKTKENIQSIMAQEMVDILSNHINENELCLRRKMNNEEERN
jgi:activator of HSP90 ATPase